MSNLLNLADLLEKAALALREADAKLSSLPAIKTTRIEESTLSVRARKGLMRLEIYTLEQLQEKTADDLRETRGMGPTVIYEIRKCLGRKGMALKGE